METLARGLSTQLIAVVCLALVAGLGGCAHGTKSPGAAKPNPSNAAHGQPYGPDEPYGPFAPAPPPQYGPDFQVVRPVVLVLGPGLARAYAYTGVIRALVDAKVKIGAIVGTEMGALIGSLYALDGSVNKLDWGVQRFRDEIFETDDSMFTKLLNKNSSEKLDEALDHVFGDRDAAQAKIPLKILIQPAGTEAKLLDRGELKLLVRAALGNTNGFSPIELDGVPTGTAAAIRPFDVQDAKALGIGPVIAVDVLDPKESDLYPELKQADLVLQPDVHAIGKTDFKKRTDAVFAGKAVTREHLDEIRKLTGGGNP